MPLHAQIICIGGNALLGVLMLIAAAQGFSGGDLGLAVFLMMLASACGYTIWVLLKFRHYLGKEATQEREAHLAQLRHEMDAGTTQTASASETPPNGPIH
jgi:hypothetical protein